MKKILTLLLAAAVAITVFVACDNTEEKGSGTSQSGSQESFDGSAEDSSVYDDDWYSSSAQSGEQSGTQEQSVSFEEDDDADWTPMF